MNNTRIDSNGRTIPQGALYVPPGASRNRPELNKRPVQISRMLAGDNRGPGPPPKVLRLDSHGKK